MSQGRARLVEIESSLDRIARARSEALERSRRSAEVLLELDAPESQSSVVEGAVETFTSRVSNAVRSVIAERRYAETLRYRESTERERLEAVRREWNELRGAFGESRSSRKVFEASADRLRSRLDVTSDARAELAVDDLTGRRQVKNGYSTCED
jgi:t-SNARE complex subunit (syntaxin)